MKIAVVTGASSGLGREYVQLIAQKGVVDEIWVVARRRDRIEQLAAACPLNLRLFPLDLTDESSFTTLEEALTTQQADVRLLINCAGFGKFGDYAALSQQDSMDMIDLNCKAVVQSTLTVLPFMSRGARILQVSSSSAFQPLPSLNVYAATKAFVLQYSRALRWELFGRGIGVTAVCPYWIRDTEFISIAKEHASSDAVRSFPFASRAACVARRSLRHSRLNLPVSTPSAVALLQRMAGKLIPRELIILFWQLFRRL